MPRPSLANDKRRELIPIIARAFADLGYRRTTTAELAQRCKVQETILYRLWPDKKAMFIASIDYIYDLATRTWMRLIQGKQSGSTAEKLLSYESTHLGEFGHARIIFAGLSETDDPDIRRAMSTMYLRYQSFILDQVNHHRAGPSKKPATKSAKTTKQSAQPPDPTLTAWALLGLGTVATIAIELDLLSDQDRRKLMIQIGSLLLGSRAD